VALTLATMMVLTPDLDEARRFYCGTLGFGLRGASESQLVLEHAGAAFHVFRCEEAAPPSRHGARAASIFVFGVADIEAAMADLRAKGVNFIHERPAGNAHGLYAAFHAPGGNVHEIFETSGSGITAERRQDV